MSAYRGMALRKKVQPYPEEGTGEPICNPRGRA
jgi:hypothetical protein